MYKRQTIRCAVDASAAKPGDAVKQGVRPEHLRAGVSDNALQTKVTFVESLGSMTYASVCLLYTSRCV